MKHQLIITGALALALGACGGGTEEAAPAEEEAVAESLTPGAYELTLTTTSISSTDGTDPATALTMDDVVQRNICIGEDGQLPATALLEDGDTCELDSDRARRGRITQALTCTREGNGNLNLQVEGDFTADSIEGTVRTGTYFPGAGDYQLAQAFAATRTGDCS
ncbi:DUF3617 domain-containing protein [Sphingomicrobium sediminis]|uniref:DUF3617 family protein n=1 Tax=Sphingomicrobium sediminis TaxID=2950949 RepID=A0A9X2EJ64_9SPHN|nr:DUF3617 family protein [Sphingomicrobium sediminis]MCM8557761.1 DUF3617 family protein [Sphingomicrobium sediminis]